MTTVTNLLEIFDENEIIPMDTIMNTMDLSERRTRNLIGKLKKLGHGYGFEIKTVTNAGYKLIKTNDSLCNKLYDAHVFSDLGSIGEIKLMKTLALHIMNDISGETRVDDLVCGTGMSREEVLHVLRSCRSRLAEFDLMLNLDGESVTIDGCEYDKRVLLTTMITDGDTPATLLNLLPSHTGELVMTMLDEAFAQNNLVIRESGKKTLTAAIEVMLMRSYQDQKMRDFYINMLLVDYRCDNVAKTLIHALQFVFNLEFSKEEKNALAYAIQDIVMV
ncbi:hypothetical protein G7062_08125 [Erysipelothrix sp. HDW6C]|uniref:hypothetical protein n=1 Tax=Erysipelothrix sp. HDW6C TaxID=2714930 RepID=UPI001407D587|nr:hypothetical protein [Erysipelothrix sp. HDW6C]QIK70257.1 hypothetical protein G7062_08125 [Erysipelothrix sp. HDW6C]